LSALVSLLVIGLAFIYLIIHYWGKGKVIEVLLEAAYTCISKAVIT